MARPVQRSTDPALPWSFAQVCEAADVPRGLGRALRRVGLISDNQWTIRDVPLTKTAAALFAFPGPDADVTEERNKTAMRLARGITTDPDASLDTFLLVSPAHVAVVEEPATLEGAATRMGGDSFLVLPVALWAAKWTSP